MNSQDFEKYLIPATEGKVGEASNFKFEKSIVKERQKPRKPKYDKKYRLAINRCLKDNPDILQDEALLRKREYDDFIENFKSILPKYLPTLLRYKVYPTFMGYERFFDSVNKNIIDVFLNPKTTGEYLDENYIYLLGGSTVNSQDTPRLSKKINDLVCDTVEEFQWDLTCLIKKNKYKCLKYVSSTNTDYETEVEIIMDIRISPSADFITMIEKYI